MMTYSKYESDQIKSYLGAVRARLAGPERDETLAGLESHIHDAIQARRDAGEEGNLVAAVLAEMDSPEQYGNPNAPAHPPTSRFAITGACLFAIGFLAHLIAFSLKNRDYQQVTAMIACGLVILGIIFARLAISEIKRSNGTVGGMALALTFYLIPLVLTVIAIGSMFLAEAGPRALGESSIYWPNVMIMAVVGIICIAYPWYAIRKARHDL